MKRLVVAMCGAAALGVTAFAGSASATPLKMANPLNGSEAANITEQVAWRRVCTPTRRGPACQTVWVGPRRGPAYRGPGFYGPPPPRYGYYAPAPRWGGPGYY